MFFERPTTNAEQTQGSETAILVHIDFPEGVNREDLNEFRELVISAGADPLDLVTANAPRRTRNILLAWVRSKKFVSCCNCMIASW